MKDLHGYRSYALDTPLATDAPDRSRLMLLHGDNGSGKTTLLRLIWHTLSSADSRGHRSYLARTPFKSLTIEFSSGQQLIVNKLDGVVGDFTISLVTNSSEKWTVLYPVDEQLRVSSQAHTRWDLYGPPPEYTSHQNQLEIDIDDPAIRQILNRRDLARRGRNERPYLEFLEHVVGIPLFLADDRILYSDDPDHNRTREVLSRRNELHERLEHLPTSRQVSLELSITIRRVNDTLRSLTLGGQNDGSANSNAIYADVLRRLIQAPTSPANTHPSSDEEGYQSSIDLLAEISKRSPSYEQFDLTPPLDVSTFSALLSEATRAGMGEVASSIIKPFLSSIQAQQHALSEAQQLLEALIPTANEFLRDKYLSFSPRRGLSIRAKVDGQSLEPEDLSSGERQLLMVLFTTLLARFDTKLFIIDEPELSLGVKWQRKLVDALLKLTEGSSVQFIIATHSIEIISSHIDSLVQLRPE